MSKILFVINSLNVGGAEKALVSLLNLLPKDRYNIDLYMLKKEGLFLGQVPPYVNIYELPFPYTALSHSSKDIYYYLRNGFSYWFKKIWRTYKAKRATDGCLIQNLWRYWKNDIKSLDKEYDIAVSFIEGSTNYFVIDKVKAKKKILWMHTDYDKWSYVPKFDAPYFEAADKVVTISNTCREALVNNFPEISSGSFIVLENLTSVNLINSLSNEVLDDTLFSSSKKKKIVSVGRLDPIKAYDLALNAACELRKKGVDLIWYIIGGGKIREELENLKSSLGLDGYVYFIGPQINPYKYMKHADVLVQSSKFEGKSIVLDEAKILQVPIVSTNYTTVYDAIEDGITGKITEMTSESLSAGIYEMLTNDTLRYNIKNNLRKFAEENVSELEIYLKILSV